ncbi:MAG TPA: conjugative transposon protein TraJ, partial [Chitinophagaceae bacterium]|nr:conjugative transposon protein TraJ [Chitinophagaceae bacterium]
MQLLAIDWNDLHEILKNLYTQFLPMANTLIGAGRAIAGTGAVLYVASRVWRHIANAEPIDFYPLFRP